MRGLMQEEPLLLSRLLEHAEREHPAVPIVSRLPDGSVHRETYAQMASRARRVGALLRGWGLALGDRVGTLAWNTHRHVELYFGISGVGAVCHTLNPRLSDEQTAHILASAGGRVLFVDLDLVDVAARVISSYGRPDALERVVVLCEGERLPAAPASALGALGVAVTAYEEEISSHAPLAAWPNLDERLACGLCYTSGTTGAPKGVLYSHRSTVLHTLAVCGADAFEFTARDVVMPVVPMFHVMAWGIPYAAAATGFELVLPGPRLDGASLLDLMEAEGVTVAAGVPTVWLGLARELDARGAGTLRRLISGGAPVPRSLVADFADRHAIAVQHAWGMTELSPVAGVNAPRPGTPSPEDVPAYADQQGKQGRPPFGISIKVVGDDGRELPRDGASAGHVKARGHWVLRSYFGGPDDVLDAEGWFATGDIGVIDPDGFLRITDRSKDVIKSGGEWISSLALEDLATSHPMVEEAAAIGVPNATWGERPVLFCVPRAGAPLADGDVLAHLRERAPRWWLPDRVHVVEALPHTATGKLNKAALRERYARSPDASFVAATGGEGAERTGPNVASNEAVAGAAMTGGGAR